MYHTPKNNTVMVGPDYSTLLSSPAGNTHDLSCTSPCCACIFVYLFISFFLLPSDHAAVYGQPRHVHEKTETGHDGGTADEGSGQGGESQEAGELTMNCVFTHTHAHVQHTHTHTHARMHAHTHTYTQSLPPPLQAEKDRLEREKQARLEAEQRQMELEERLRCTEDEVRKAIHARLQTEEALKMMQEQVCWCTSTPPLTQELLCCCLTKCNNLLVADRNWLNLE